MLLQPELIYGSHVYTFKNCHGVQYQLIVDTHDSSHEILQKHIVDVNLIPIIGHRDDNKFLYDKDTRQKICSALYKDFIIEKNKTLKVDFFLKDDKSRILVHKFVRWLQAYHNEVHYELEILDLLSDECVHVKILIWKKGC